MRFETPGHHQRGIRLKTTERGICGIPAAVASARPAEAPWTSRPVATCAMSIRPERRHSAGAAHCHDQFATGHQRPVTLIAPELARRFFIRRAHHAPFFSKSRCGERTGLPSADCQTVFGGLAAGVQACRVFPTTPHGARGSILRQEYENLCEKSGCAMRANLEHPDQ